jgi:ribokinase
MSIAGEDAGEVVDSTGAGDAFCGALAAFLAEGLDLADAARKANAAAALSVRKAGARGGMTTRQELEGYLKRSPSV